MALTMVNTDKYLTQESARGLREVVDERGAVIDLLQREVESLKAAWANMDAERDVPTSEAAPVVDLRLEAELKQVRVSSSLASK